MDHDGGVVDPVLITQGCADDQHRHQFGRGHDDIEQRVLDRVEQSILQQNVLDRVAGQRQLREDRQRSAVVVAGPGDSQHRLSVYDGVRDGRVVRARSHPHKSLAVRRVEIHASLLPENVQGYATPHECAATSPTSSIRWRDSFQVRSPSSASSRPRSTLCAALLRRRRGGRRRTYRSETRRCGFDDFDDDAEERAHRDRTRTEVPALTRSTASCWPAVRPRASCTTRRF